MTILSWDKPAKVIPTKVHNAIYSSDSGVEGTYVPNMSDEDKAKWKARHIKGLLERIEIRKTVDGTQLLLIAYKTPQQHHEWEAPYSWKLSSNGSLRLSNHDMIELLEAIKEASAILNP